MNKGLPKSVKGWVLSLLKVLIELSAFSKLVHWFLPY